MCCNVVCRAREPWEASDGALRLLRELSGVTSGQGQGHCHLVAQAQAAPPQPGSGHGAVDGSAGAGAAGTNGQAPTAAGGPAVAGQVSPLLSPSSAVEAQASSAAAPASSLPLIGAPSSSVAAPQSSAALQPSAAQQLVLELLAGPVADLAVLSHFRAAQRLRETLWTCLPVIARNLGESAASSATARCHHSLPQPTWAACCCCGWRRRLE